MTDEQIQTFVDLIEWAEMLDAEHPANVAQRVEKEIDAELPYQRDLKRWEHRIVFAPQKSDERLKWEADYRQKRAEHRASFVKQFYGGR